MKNEPFGYKNDYYEISNIPIYFYIPVQCLCNINMVKTQPMTAPLPEEIRKHFDVNLPEELDK